MNGYDFDTSFRRAPSSFHADNDDDEDELYQGFGDNDVGSGSNTRQVSQNASKNREAVGSHDRLGTAQFAGEDIRPMTSVKGAGYRGEQLTFDPLRQSMGKLAPALQQRSEEGPAFVAREMEKEVNAMIEDSARAHTTKDVVRALTQAKQASKKQRILQRHCANNSLTDQVNSDLKFAVGFNLAIQYEANQMSTEAMNVFTSLVKKKKQFAHAGRLRVNMGNIYFAQSKYQLAIKMYRMAMDQIGSTSSQTRYKIMRNIAVALVRLGQYQDAIQSYEAVMEACSDAQSAFNLIVCYYACGDQDKMKKGFLQLLGVPLQVADLNLTTNSGHREPEDTNDSLSNDSLAQFYEARREQHSRYVLLAAKLIAPVIERTYENGFDWILEHLRSTMANLMNENSDECSYGNHQFSELAMQIEICKGVGVLKQHRFENAFDILRRIEGQGAELHDQAATNLSFLYFLEGDHLQAKKFADLSLAANRYNSSALVNRSNIFVVSNEYDNAQQMFLEAIGVETECTEAMYNLDLVSKRAGQYQESMQAFRKLHGIVPKSATVMYEIADLYELMGDEHSAIEWLKIVQGVVPGDPHILARLGHLTSKMGLHNQAFHHFSESYQVYPVNMEVISWLGVWYVKSELYEQAVQFFERAAEIEPYQLKWKLMVASCLRRMNNIPAALSLYKRIHHQDPESIECLRYLCSICQEIGDQSYAGYADQLQRLEKMNTIATESLDTNVNIDQVNTSLHESTLPNTTQSILGQSEKNHGHSTQSISLSNIKLPPTDDGHIINQKHRVKCELVEDEWDGVELDDELLPM